VGLHRYAFHAMAATNEVQVHAPDRPRAEAMAARRAGGTTFSFPWEASGGFTEDWEAAGAVWGGTELTLRIQDGFHHDIAAAPASPRDNGRRGNRQRYSVCVFKAASG